MRDLSLDGSFNYPSAPKSTRFLYYLSVYGNLSKNSFLLPSFPKAGAKVRLFLEPTKLFEEKILFFSVRFTLLDFGQSIRNLTPYYYSAYVKEEEP